MATQEDHEDPSEVFFSLVAGTDLVSGQIVVSHDSKYFACCAGWNVKVHNTTNGQCAQLLEGHTDVVTGLIINSANKLQLFSCGLDGTVKQWIYLEGVLLRTYSFYMPLHALVTMDPSATSVCAIAHRPQSANCSLLRLQLKKQRTSSVSEAKDAGGGGDVSVKTDVLLPVCEADHRTVSNGCNGHCIAAIHGHELFVVTDQKKAKGPRRLTTEVSNPFTCVACHPTESCIATGHRNGKITFWWNIFSKEKTVVSTVHWHSLAVECLAFSPEGSSLLSGGHECVVVRWQMNSEHRDFLPRLGSPLRSLTPSPDGTLFITAHTDNVAQVVSSSFHIQQAVRGLARAPHMAVGLVQEPRSGALVTNGRPGHLQFYCMHTDHQLFNLDIVGQNYISPENLQKPLTVTEVEHATFDPSGDWLATYQRWEDGVLSPEYCLKFWKYNRKTQNYQLNTTVETPHYQAVRCLRFRKMPQVKGPPPDPMLVSTGKDGFFKLWTLAPMQRSGQQWTCVSVGHFRGQAAGAARFSLDGRRLAVVFDNVVSLWDPDSNAMMDKLIMDLSVRCVEFTGGDSGHYIVVSTATHLTVLDFPSLSVHMQISMPDALLATDGDLVCAVSSQQDLYVFRPSERAPVLQKSRVTEHPVVSAVFLPSAQGKDSHTASADCLGGRSQLHLLDSQHRIFTPTLGAKKSPTPWSRSQVQLTQVLPQTPFQALLAADQDQSSTGPAAGTQAADHRRLRPLEGFDVMNKRIDTEDHFSRLAQSLLETMMVRVKGCAEPMDVEQRKEEDEDEDVDMATES